LNLLTYEQWYGSSPTVPLLLALAALKLVLGSLHRWADFFSSTFYPNYMAMRFEPPVL